MGVEQIVVRHEHDVRISHRLSRQVVRATLCPLAHLHEVLDVSHLRQHRRLVSTVALHLEVVEVVAGLGLHLGTAQRHLDTILLVIHKQRNNTEWALRTPQ